MFGRGHRRPYRYATVMSSHSLMHRDMRSSIVENTPSADDKNTTDPPGAYMLSSRAAHLL